MPSFLGRLFNRPRVQTTTAIQSFATFRYGQDITEDDIDRALRRVPLIVLAGMIIPEKAMKVGIEIVSKKGDKEEVQDDLTKDFDKLGWMPTLIRGVQYETNYGSIAFSLHFPLSKEQLNGEENSEIKDKEIILKAFRPKNIDIGINELGLVDGYMLTEKIDSPKKPELYHHVPKQDEKGNVIGSPEELQNVIFRCLRQGDVWWRGHPKWEGMWDVARSHYSSLEASMVGNVRRGYGQKIATLWDRGDDDENAKVKSSTERGMVNLDSGDTSIVMYSIVDPQGNVREDKIDVDFGDSQYNHAEDIDTYHKVASFLLSVPKNLLDGIFSGETLAGDIIYRMLQEALHEFRVDWIEPFNAILRRWAELTGRKWGDDFTVRFKTPKAKLTEREEAEIDQLEANTQSTLKISGIVDTEDARDKLGLEKKEIIPEEEEPIRIKVNGDDDDDEQDDADNE